VSTQSAHERLTPSKLLEHPGRTLLAPVRFVGFWSAVVLPLVLLPMLVSGLAGQYALPFAALVVANLVAAIVGRNYHST